jgi:predicted  nucleic acid-binding Zn-ribbon protein
MPSVAATQIPASRLNVDWTPVRDTLAALRAGHESLDLFVGQLFSGLEAMRERLDQYDRRIKDERRQVAEDRQRFIAEQAEWERSRTQPVGEEAQRVAELEQERSELEEELETVRQRCEELAETVAEQKRQIAEERAAWTAEFRQLRKVLDQQSQILTQRVEHNHAAPVAAACGSGNGSAVAAAAVRTEIDPVLGSVMSQFQLLQKDAARRRAQQAKNKAS